MKWARRKLTVDSELEGGQSSDHEQPGADSSVAAAEPKLAGDLEQTARGGFAGEALGLVDLREHGVGRLGDDGGGETGDETGTQVGDGDHAV